MWIEGHATAVRRSELFSYETCIFYTVLTSVQTLDRVSLKSKVVNAPEILTVIESIPNLSTYLNALYKCQYADFFKVSSLMLMSMVHSSHWSRNISETVQTLSLDVPGAPACSGLVVLLDSSLLCEGPKSAAELVNVLSSAAPLHAPALISLSERSLLQWREPLCSSACGNCDQCRVLAVQAFAGIADQVREDIYLHRHLRYYVREVRVVAYSQVHPHSLPNTFELFLYMLIGRPWRYILRYELV